MSKSPLADALIPSALLLGLLTFSLNFIQVPVGQPWDFETYCFATVAALKGFNPYDTDVLSRFAHRPVGMPFLYPLIVLPVFIPFTRLTIPAAEFAWLTLGVLALICMLHVWRRVFLPAVSPFLLCLPLAFGFNSAATWALKTGNVAVVEQLLLWLGFAAFVRGQRGVGAAWIIAAASFKLVPIVFLLLLVLPVRSRGASWGTLAISACCFALLVLGPVIFGPPWAGEFLHGGPKPWGAGNPSASGLFDMLFGGSPGWIPWLGYVVVLVGASAPALLRAWKDQDPVRWVMVATSLFVLLHPRPMAYAYLLAVPAMFALVAPVVGSKGNILVTAVVCAQIVLSLFVPLQLKNPWIANLPFLLLLGLWLVYVWGGNRGTVLKKETVLHRKGSFAPA